MVLTGLNLFGDNNFFSDSPDDNQILIWDGQRWLAGNNIGLQSQTKSAASEVNDATIGTVAWVNLAGPGLPIQNPLVNVGGEITDNSVRLVIGGSIAGSDLARGISLPVDTWQAITYGNSQEMWGNFIDAAIVNNANFGLVLGLKGVGGGAAIGNYVKYTNFGFDIPTDAIVVGIAFDVLLLESTQGATLAGSECIETMTVFYIGAK